MVAPGAKWPLRPTAACREATQSRVEALALVEERFRDFDVVWAKVHGFPWWPGVLFFSWDVVRRAGIRTDPKIVAELVVPKPEKVEQLATTKGSQATSSSRLKRHCLIMFLDKFNFSVVEMDPSSVASFTAHYDMYERAVMNSKTSRKKAEFKRAVVKATQLLHMGKGAHVDDDLAMLEQPGPMDRVEQAEEDMEADSEEEEHDRELDNVRASREKEDETAGNVEEKVGEKRSAENSQKKSIVRGGNVLKVKDVTGDNGVMIVAKSKPRHKALSAQLRSRGQRTSRKEAVSAAHVAVLPRSPPPLDLAVALKKKQHAVHYDEARGKGPGKLLEIKTIKSTAETDSTVQKGAKKNSRVEVSVMKDVDGISKQLTEQNDDQISDEDAEKERQRGMVLTPLSSIWTTGLSSEPNTESNVQTSLLYKQDFLWDGAVFSNELSLAEKKKAAIERKQTEDGGVGLDRSGKRQSRSAQQSHIRQQLVAGDLDPHTMVQCVAYRSKGHVDDPNSRSRGGPMLDPPFQVVVHPDAVFVADLHAHLATCEIIGFLGGKWDEASKTLYIQAAFPCRSLVIDGDDGSTDVEMDPGSEIELRSIIENAQLEVVGWYHSHPAFAPDPSVRDIENQTSYQQLFQRPCTSIEVGANCKPSEPFVGLIVGTYDTRRSTPVSLFRYFHTRGEKVSGGARREIHMPYEFIPERCHFRSVLQDEERVRTRLFPLYQSVLQHFGFELAACQSQHLPVSSQSTATMRNAMPGSSLRRGRGSFGKRKQQTGSMRSRDKPLKKARARGRSPLRSILAARDRVDQSGDDDNRKLEVLKNEALTSKSALEFSDNESKSEITKSKKDGTLHSVDNQGKTNAITPLPTDAQKNTGCDNVSATNVKSEVRSAEEQVGEVPANAFENTGAHELLPQALHLGVPCRVYGRSILSETQCFNRINESVAGSDANRLKQPLNENGMALSPHPPTTPQKLVQQVVSKSDEAASGWKVGNVIAAVNDTCIAQASLSPPSSGVIPGVLASTDTIVSGRKRTRKPKKPMKYSHRSTSPSSDQPIPSVSPNQTKTPVQTLYDAFRLSGPHFSNGGTHEGITPLLGHGDGPKVDNGLAEGLQYIFVDEAMDMTTTSNGCSGPLAVQKDAGAPSVAMMTKDSDRVNEEVRRFVASLVEKVVEEVASKITAGLSLHEEKAKGSFPLPKVPNWPSDSSGAQVFLNSHKNAKVESSSVKSEPDVHAGAAESNAHSNLQLFGSKGECEDIQTSLQKMADQLDKWKSFQSARPSVAATNLPIQPIPAIESKLVVAEVDPVQDECKVEQDHLAALRTKYGAGVSRCAEQAITLVDYYRSFERRTDLDEIWKSRITKLEKIESSLSEYVQYLNIPVALRRDFVKDLIQYLRGSWATADRR
uniref:MPN domain-containing protein n=1 Tax=Peronospora matthiolae TaxID=2874970 RepID=A0AAV1TGN9_9STRA